MSRARLIFLVMLGLALLSASVTQAARSKRPDLVATAKAAPGEVAPGGLVTVDLVVRNAGRRAAKPSTAELWLSADRRRGGADARLGRASVRGLRARGSARAKIAVRLPVAARSGSQHLLACADGRRRVREAKEANNCAAVPLVVKGAPKPGPTVAPAGGTSQPSSQPASQPSPSPSSPAPPAPPAPAPPAPAPGPAPAPDPAPAPGDRADLAVTDVSDPPASAREGSRFALRDTTANRGAGAPATATRFYLSPDSAASLERRRASTADPRTALEDVLLSGARELGPLAGGARSEAPEPGTEVTVPVGTRPGVYDVLACADDRGAAAETDEERNCAVATHPEGGEERPSRITILAEEQEYRVDAHSDLFEDADEDDEERLGKFRDAFCATPAARPVASVTDAVASVRGFLTDTAGADAMAAFAASPEYGDPQLAQAAAAAAVTNNRPGAALAALVRAHELEPAEASHLVNAAAVASSVGLPAEALAMLDGAQRLDDHDRPAMGLSRHAVALTNRGQALALLGRHAEADAALDGALAAEPLLTEASATKSATTVCREGAGPAVKHRRKGRTRQGPKPLDPSSGKETVMRDLPLPGFPKQAATMKPFYQKQRDRLSAESTDRQARGNAIAGRLRDKQDEWTPSQRNRHHGTIMRIYGVGYEPDIAALRAEMDRRRHLALETQRGFWGQGQGDNGRYWEFRQSCAGAADFTACMNDACRPALRGTHQTWLDQVQDYYDAAQVYVRAASRRMSGYASHLADPDAHAQALLQIEELEESSFAGVMQLAQFWTHDTGIRADHCVEVLEDPAAVVQEAGAVASDGGCSSATKGMKAVAKLGPTTMKISCEKVQQSIKWEAVPWLQAFAEVTYDRRLDKITIVAGSKAEVPAGVAKGTFKSGVYLTVDGRGDITDVGWRVGPSATVGSGPVEMEVFKDEIDLSFVGAVSSTYGL